jgi:hypothetical protein
MTQQQAVLQAATPAAVLQIDRRSPERQTLSLRINDLAAAAASLASTNRALSDDFDARCNAENELTTLRTAAPDMGTEPLLRKIEQAVLAGVEPSIRFFNDEEEKFGKRLKSALQDVEFYTRRRAASEARIPDEEMAVVKAQRKVREAALAVIRASDAVAMTMNDLETMQNVIAARHAALRFFGSNDILPADEEAEVKRLMNQAAFVNWDKHPVRLRWAAALEKLMVDADAELPCE